MCFDHSYMLPISTLDTNIDTDTTSLSYQYKHASYFWFGLLSQLKHHEDSDVIFHELHDLCHGKSPRYARYLSLYLGMNIVKQYAMFPIINEQFRYFFNNTVSIEEENIEISSPK